MVLIFDLNFSRQAQRPRMSLCRHISCKMVQLFLRTMGKITILLVFKKCCWFGQLRCL